MLHSLRNSFGTPRNHPARAQRDSSEIHLDAWWPGSHGPPLPYSPQRPRRPCSAGRGLRAEWR
eukprot:3539113-Alexandrium_andersonii.AAC.1